MTRTAQVIVLSHNKSFLCNVWENANKNERVTLELLRQNNCTELSHWDINRDCITEHDKRSTLLTDYLQSQSKDKQRQVAQAIRPHLEAFLRVALPAYFPPGTLLGSFLNRCKQNLNSTIQILNSNDVQELESLVEYGNKFHHDTNPAWENENINDTELCGFIHRTLVFVRRPV